ncbi:hypothetical protein B0H10DRAFT_1962246 [Mycena sp. CBHHK59/15]|nr:hypothetical protein B0H10DRAFT_1962246 [Mycena sp. CBHHK59/15]
MASLPAIQSVWKSALASQLGCVPFWTRLDWVAGDFRQPVVPLCGLDTAHHCVTTVTHRHPPINPAATALPARPSCLPPQPTSLMGQYIGDLPRALTTDTTPAGRLHVGLYGPGAQTRLHVGLCAMGVASCQPGQLHVGSVSDRRAIWSYHERAQADWATGEAGSAVCRHGTGLGRSVATINRFGHSPNGSPSPSLTNMKQTGDSTEEAAGAVPAYESTTPCGDNGARTGQVHSVFDTPHMDDLKAQEPTFLRIRLSLYHHPQLLALAEPRGCGWSDATTACKRSCCVACAGFEAFRPQEVCASLSVNDPRFVMIIVEDWVYEWELAAGTGRDIWTRGLDFIASKANGEIPGRDVCSSLPKSRALMHDASLGGLTETTRSPLAASGQRGSDSARFIRYVLSRLLWSADDAQKGALRPRNCTVRGTDSMMTGILFAAAFLPSDAGCRSITIVSVPANAHETVDTAPFARADLWEASRTSDNTL